MALSIDPIAEWLLDEAPTGRSPLVAADNSGGGNDLDVIYDVTEGNWTSITEGNGFDIDAAMGTAASALILDNVSANGNIATKLNGATKASLILVARFDEFNPSLPRLFQIGQSTANGDFSLCMGEYIAWGFPHALSVRWDNVSDNLWTIDASSGVHVYHVVVDTSLSTATDRIRIWKDATQLTTSQSSPPSSNQAITVDASRSVCILNRGNLARNPDAAVFYCALFDDVLTAQDISDSYDALILNNDVGFSPSTGVTVTPETGSFGLNSDEPVVSHVPAAVSVTPETGSFGLNADEPVVSHIPAAQTTTPETGSFGLNADEPVVSSAGNITLTAADASFGMTADTVVMLRYEIDDLTFGITTESTVVTNVAATAIIVTAETGSFGLNSSQPVVSHIAAAGTVTPHSTSALGLNSTEPAVSHIPAAATVSPQSATLSLLGSEPAVTSVPYLQDYIDSLVLSNVQLTAVDADYSAHTDRGIAYWAVWDYDNIPAAVDLAAIQGAVGAEDNGQSATITAQGPQTTIVPTVTDTEDFGYRFYIVWADGADESLVYSASFGRSGGFNAIINEVINPVISDVIREAFY